MPLTFGKILIRRFSKSGGRPNPEPRDPAVLDHDGGLRAVRRPSFQMRLSRPRPEAGPPQKRPGFGVGSCSLHLYSITFRRSRAMVLFLVLYWCAAVARAVLRYDSRFGLFNSRLGPHKFPFSRQRELAGKGLIYLVVLCV